MRRPDKLLEWSPIPVAPSEKDSYVTRARVILAEDHPEIAWHLRALLGSEYDVLVVPDGRALMAATNQEMPDIILSDIRMPDLSGLAAALSILSAHSEARLIFVTILDDPAVIRKALAQGARGYVIKSDAGEELADAVQAVLGGGQYVSSSAQRALQGRT